jgi:hypothetical protein
VAGISASPPVELTKMTRRRSIASRPAAASASESAAAPSAAAVVPGGAQRLDRIPILRSIAAGSRPGSARAAISAVARGSPASAAPVPRMRAEI